jgi:hypothetical protein
MSTDSKKNQGENVFAWQIKYQKRSIRPLWGDIYNYILPKRILMALLVHFVFEWNKTYILPWLWSHYIFLRRHEVTDSAYLLAVENR